MLGQKIDENRISSKQLATFAGGCFWCLEPPFADLEGVIGIKPGYTGGHIPSPSYEAVVSGKTGHVEAVQIQFDETRVSYNTLLDIFWRQIDPTDDKGQFADKGSQYKTAIFYHSDQQKEDAQASKDALEKKKIFKRPIVTEIKQAQAFYVAEEYHHEYYKKNPVRYKSYKYFSGREPFLEKTWKKK